jgi:hypothetical protein
VQFGVTLASGIESTHQLANAGAVQVGHIAKIQKNAAAAIFEQVGQQFVNGFAFDQGKATPYIHNRYISQLPGTGTKTHRKAPGKNTISF